MKQRKANVNNEAQIYTQLNKKREKLVQICDSDYPSDVSLHKRHQEKIENAKAFISELDDLFRYFFDCKLNLTLVNKPTFDKYLVKYNTTDEFDGTYCKVSAIHFFPLGSGYIINVASIDEI